MPAQRNQRSTRPATTRAGSTIDQVVEGQNGDTGSEASRRLHTNWHETVPGIDPRTAR
jgi:hypothetical protein